MFRHPANGRQLVLRVNAGSQMHLDRQIEYEAHALKLLGGSGRTPRVYYVDGSGKHIGHGVLVEEYLPGNNPRYDNRAEMNAVMECMADIHAVPVPEEEVIYGEPESVPRDTVKLMASLGVRSMKCGRMMELGEWTEKEVRDLQLTREEELEMFEEYIPQYFEDDAPLSIMMADTLMYTPGDSKWRIYDVRRVPEEKAKYAPSCGVLLKNFYIGADGMVAPCMGMCDTGFAKKFPNLFETPLRDIMHDSELTTLCEATVEEVRNHNPECRSCKYVDRCTGGCRNSVLTQGDDYYGIDKKLCYFFENGWEERITKAAEEPFREYLKRNPSKNTERKEVSEQEEDPYL